MCKTPTILKVAGTIAALVTAAGSAYWFLVRPWQRAWGTTEDERNRALPGDDLLPQPRLKATHAVTIHAPVEKVWPWLAQMGRGRGGLYSYEWIENAGMGLDIHNVDRIVPELQNLKVGDVMPLGPDNFGPQVVTLEPNRVMVLHGDTRQGGEVAIPDMKPGDYLAVLWTFYLEPAGANTTRLIERFVLDYNPTTQNQFMYGLFLEPGAFIMERKMLLGIKQRAECIA
jgi:hypothetical protein